MTIAIAGKNEIACRFLEYLKTNNSYSKHQLLAVINSTDNSQHSWQRSFKLVANDLGVEVVTESELYEINDLIFISLEYDRIIRPDKFASCELFNIHFSLLPEYKGMYTSIIPILNGEKYSGVTLHRIDKGIDTGDIIAQKKIHISSTSTSEELYYELLEKGYQLIVSNIDSLIEMTYSAEPQSCLGSSYFSKAAIDFQNIPISSVQTAFQVEKFVRAFCFRPYQRPKWKNSDIDIAYILEQTSTYKPGTIIHEDAFQFIISTIDYDIKLIKAKDEELLEYVRAGEIERLKEYRGLGGRICSKNQLGWDVAIVAAYAGNYDILEWALANGISKTTVNYNGTTLPMYLLSHGEKVHDFSLLRRFLKEQDINVNIKDYSGFTVMDYALKRGIKQAVQILNEYK